MKTHLLIWCSYLVIFWTFVDVASAQTQYPIQDCLTDELDILFIEDTSELPDYEYRSSLELKFLAFMEVFIRDNSTNEGMDMFFQENNFTVEEKREFMFSQNNNYTTEEMERVHFAFASFAKDVTVHFDFTRRYSSIKDAALGISETEDRLVNGEADVGNALRFIAEEAFTPMMGSRPTAQHIVILLVQSLSTVSADVAREMTRRLDDQTDIRVITYHSIEDQHQNQPSVIPMSMAFRVDSISYFNDTHIRKLCKPCMHGWFIIPEEDGFACYFLHVPENDKVTYDYDQSVAMCENHDRSTFNKHADLAQIETTEEQLILEDTIFDYGVNFLPYDTLVFFYVGLVREKHTLAYRHAWKYGAPLMHKNWMGDRPCTLPVFHACTMWGLKALNPTVLGIPKYKNTKKLPEIQEMLLNNSQAYPPDAQGRAHLTYEFWLYWYGRLIVDKPCHTKTPFLLCEEKYKVLYDENPTELSSSIPSEDSVTEALSRGLFVLVEPTDREDLSNLTIEGNRTIMALSSILFEVVEHKRALTLYLNLSASPEILSRGLLMHVPRFDCQAEFGHELLPYSRVCDYKVDCSTGRDETICKPLGYRKCQNGEIPCTSGQCIPQEAWCDLYADCTDGSDEDDCHGVCKHFQCRADRCIPNSMVYDFIVDCTSCQRNNVNGKYHSTLPSDENISNAMNKIAPLIRVVNCNRTEGLKSWELATNRPKYCAGPEGRLDKVLSTLEGLQCRFSGMKRVHKNKFWGPRCVYIKDVFGTVIGCADHQHLRNCENFTCPEGYYKCPKSYCIPLHFLRNQYADCLYGEDEKLTHITENSNFQCMSKGGNPRILLQPSLVCDGLSHCPHGDDELDCDVTCRDGFLCVGGATVASDYDRTQLLTDFSFVDARTKYLDLSGINVQDFFLRFSHHHFLNLVWLNLSNSMLDNVNLDYDSGIISLADRTVREPAYWTTDFSAVMTLDLSYNHLATLDANHTHPEFNAVGCMSNLQHLNLSHNPNLVMTKSGFLFAARTIGTLDLSFTAVSELTKNIMGTFVSLRVLSLEGTRIHQIKRVFPDTLQVLDLRAIPLADIEFEAFSGLTRIQELMASTYKLCCSQVRGDTVPAHVCHTTDDAISSCDDMVQEPVLRILLWVFGFAALVGNVIVVIYRVTVDKALLKRGFGIFVMNLSLSDFLMGLYLLMIAYTDVQYRGKYVWYERSWRESWTCHIAGFLSTWSCESSAMFIFLITLDRYLVIRFPFGEVRISSKGYIVTSVGAWVIGLVLALMPLLPPFQHWSIYSSNGMCVGLPLTTDKAPGWEYSTLVFVGVNFVLFILIAMGQIAIYRTMSSSRMEGEGSMSKFQYMRRQQDIAVAKQLSLVVITDFFCWFPIGTMGMMSLSGNEVGKDVYAWTAVLVLPINSAINPILYTVPALKKTLNNLIQRLFDKNSSGTVHDSKKEGEDPKGPAVKTSVDFVTELKSLSYTLQCAREFIESEPIGGQQGTALQAQSTALNKEMNEMKAVLKMKFELGA